MSPDRGRRGKSGRGRGRGGSASGPAAARRLGLAIFGVAFVVLFVVVALAEGIGDPSIPSGDVILVQNVPGDAGEITAGDVDHSIELAAAQGGEKTTPKPGDPQYEELKKTATDALLEAAWIQGLADERGLDVSEGEIAKELKKIKKESFKSEAEFQKFLKESHYTPADIDERVKIQILSRELQEQLKENAPAPSGRDIVAYYEAAKATQFTQKPNREVRLVVNKDREKAKEAREALSTDNSAANWSKVAKKYSEEAATKENGGLKKNLVEGGIEEPLNAAIFNTPEGRVEGPLNAGRGYTVFEVVGSTPETVAELKSVESQIKATLTQQMEQEYFAAFASNFSTEWISRTFCSDGFVTERCANFKSSGHPAIAPATCYEADPKAGRPENCPAAVTQLIPALPGTVSPLEPKGKPLAQRPHPAGEGEAAGEAPAGLPEGAVPPTEAPSE